MQKKSPLGEIRSYGGHRANRTHNLSLRTGLLYPIELGNQILPIS
jgi:hypothetical protein